MKQIIFYLCSWLLCAGVAITSDRYDDKERLIHKPIIKETYESLAIRFSSDEERINNGWRHGCILVDSNGEVGTFNIRVKRKSSIKLTTTVIATSEQVLNYFPTSKIEFLDNDYGVNSPQGLIVYRLKKLQKKLLMMQIITDNDTLYARCDLPSFDYSKPFSIYFWPKKSFFQVYLGDKIQVLAPA